MVIPISVNVATSTFTANGRFPFADGQQVSIDSRVPNQIPAPLVEYDSQEVRVYYFLVNVTGNSFQVSATLSGSPIALTAAGTGQMTLSEYPPLPWESLVLLPLVQVSDIRTRFTTPEALVNETAAPNAPVAVTNSGNTFTAGIETNYVDWTPVQLTGTLPSPLVAGTTYYVRDTTATTFTLATAIGGAAITLATSGSGMTVSNYALDALLITKLAVGGEWLYDALLTLVTNHVNRVNRSWWWWYGAPTEQADVLFYPAVMKAQLILDNLRNPEKLIAAWVDYTKWAMIEDGSWRNQIISPSFITQFGPTPESTAKKRAEQRLAQQAQLLLVSGYQGACRIFDFGETTGTVNISLI